MKSFRTIKVSWCQKRTELTARPRELLCRSPSHASSQRCNSHSWSSEEVVIDDMGPAYLRSLVDASINLLEQLWHAHISPEKALITPQCRSSTASRPFMHQAPVQHLVHDIRYLFMKGDRVLGCNLHTNLGIDFAPTGCTTETQQEQDIARTWACQ